VHSLKDYRYLISIGLRNVAYFVHPYTSVTLQNRIILKEKLGIDNEPVIITHGLIAPHKGFINVIKAFKKLLNEHPNALLVLLTPRSSSNSESENEYQAIKEMIKDISGNVLFFDEFLKESELFLLIQSGDVGVLGYEEVGESASGAIKSS
jgi:glycosyltransferase involved in cell wall biosynthesis